MNITKIFGGDYKDKPKELFQEHEEKVSMQLAKIKKCEDERLLVDMAVNHKNDIRVRFAACDKIASKESLNYILLATTIVPMRENFEVTLYIAKNSDSYDVVNEAMRAIMRNSFSTHYHEYVKRAISYVTDVKILEHFINNEVANQRLKDYAYERALELLGNEET